MVIKIPLITTRYLFIINELSSCVANVAIKIKNFFVYSELVGQCDVQFNSFLTIRGKKRQKSDKEKTMNKVTGCCLGLMTTKNRKSLIKVYG